MAAKPSLADQGYVKIQLSDGGYIETLWAVRLKPGQDRFRLDNSPFFAYRISEADIVEGTYIADGFYEFVRVTERSGNRTVRLTFGDEKADTPEAERVLNGIIALGCNYEGMFNKLVSITVPPEVLLEDLASYLISTDLQWEHADPTYVDLFGDD
ncbi:MAG TPA: DUF4265 domain-containing protein [Candidatus Limnocylindrales bacterium]